MRADQLLVQHGLAPTRSAAQRLIERGAGQWLSGAQWKAVRKSGEVLPDDAALRVIDDAEVRWVSRAGLKLEAALQVLGLDVSGRTALAVGQSTGGFTDVLLARGAAGVIGVDVGQGQLHPRLRDDPRVTVFEGLNARHLVPDDLGDALPDAGFALIVADVSFISLTLILPALVPLLAAGGDMLMLVKPQFELQPAQMGKGGVVRDAAHYPIVEQRWREACADNGLAVLDWRDSAVPGSDGNREFFIHAVQA